MKQNKEDYLKNLAKKRSGSGALILNEDNKILMLKTNYKTYYEIPGGVVEKNESPKECCQREIKEEISLDLRIEQLLVLEYQKLENDDSYMFLFYGGKINSSDILKADLAKNEIIDFGFYSLDEIKNNTIERLYKRIKNGFNALINETTCYYETKVKSNTNTL